MNDENINKKNKKTRILVVPLDWGLGHATRCIPLITTLLDQNADVILAAENPIALLLKKEFPRLVILPLKGYNISYGKNKSLFFLRMLWQLPKIINMISYERKWLDQKIGTEQLDAVISDNRFGLHSAKIPSIFITHQLFIETGNHFLNLLAQKINYHYIKKFSECWVPDAEGEDNLAGKLSYPARLPAIPLKYAGILSRFKKQSHENKYDLLILLSGPEPQRTIFENLLLDQLTEASGSVVLVRGLPGNDKNAESARKNVLVYNYLPAEDLNILIQQAYIVIARSGYSTLMDLLKLEKKAILVPTPGQTEQEYLADYVKRKKIFYSTIQDNFNLEKSIKEAAYFDYGNHEIPIKMNEKVVIDWLKKI